MAQGDDHTDIVREVKADLEARGFSLAGACGAFQITKRVAWRLRAEGVGLLSKPSGENCTGYAVGFIVYPNAAGYDILGDAGGDNGPQWSGPDLDPGLIGRWREPVDPGDAPAQAPPPTPEPLPDPAPEPIGDWPAEILAAFDRLATCIDSLVAAVNGLTERLDTLDANGVKFRLR